ncbi:hypothetical protein ACTJKO_07100 [Curtobacterium sp. 22159]|uniref:hypothetical protein n=1 Tax=Curtobacterium sp. 22159 TaxID=3453882 RepID=UPI003F838D26
MLRRVRASVHRVPAVARLLSIAAMLLVAAAAHTGVRSGVTACGPGTAGPTCGGNVTWVLLLVAGVALAVVTAAPAHLWPLPAIWLVVVVLAATTGATFDGAFLVTAVLGGAAALALAIVIDVVPWRRERRQGRSR